MEPWTCCPRTLKYIASRVTDEGHSDVVQMQNRI